MATPLVMIATTDLAAAGSAEAPQNVTSATLFTWHRGDTKILTNGLVSQWTDKSGNSRHLIQTGSDARPSPTGSIGGKTAVSFDGVDDYMDWQGATFDTLLDGTGAEFFFVLKNDFDPASSSTANGWGDFGETTSKAHHPHTDGIVYDDFGTTVRKTVGNITGSLTEAHLWNVQSFENEWRVIYNGSVIYFDDLNTVGFEGNQPASIGRSEPLPAKSFYEGDIAEIIGYSDKLSSADRDSVEAYITSRYGINTTDKGPFYQYGAVADWDASTGVTVSGSDVTQWADKIGGYIASQSVEANRPTYSNTDTKFGDEYSIDFNGTSDHLIGTDSGFLNYLSGSYTIAWVATNDAGSGTRSIFASAEAASDVKYTFAGYQTDEKVTLTRRDSANTEIKSTTAAPDGVSNYIITTYNGSSQTGSIYYNGILETTGGFTQSDVNSNRFSIGNLARVSNVQFHDGKIRNLVIFPDVLAGADLENVHGELAALNGELPYKPIADWNADQNVELDGTDVMSWTDTIGGYIVSQSNASIRPTYAADEVNSRAAVLFDGATTYLQDDGTVLDGAIQLSASYTAVFVMKPGSVHNGSLLSTGDGTNASETLFSERTGGKIALYRNTSLIQWDLTPTVTISDWNICALAYDSSSTEARIRLNGNTATDTNTDDMTGTPTLLRVGARPDASATQKFDGHIARVVIYDKVLSANQLEAVSKQLNKQYKLDEYAPAASPYASYGAIAHWDAAYGVVQESGEARKWIDRVGNYTVSQSTSANRPTWSNSDTVFEDEYSIDFDDANTEYLISQDPTILSTLSGSHTIAAVVDFNTGAEATNVLFGYGSGDADTDWGLYGSVNTSNMRLQINEGGNLDSYSPAVSIGSPAYVIYSVTPGGSVQMRANGTTIQSTASANIPAAAERFAIGARPRQSIDNALEGKIREIIVFNSFLTGSNLVAVESLMANKV